jgi:hypothetical protein
LTNDVPLFQEMAYMQSSQLHRSQPMRALDDPCSSSTTGVMEAELYSVNAIDLPKTYFTVKIPQRWAGNGGKVCDLKPKMKSGVAKEAYGGEPCPKGRLCPGGCLLYSQAPRIRPDHKKV